MSGHNRSRPRRQVTLSPEVDAYLGQKHINASRLVDAAVREKVQDRALDEAAREAGVGRWDPSNMLTGTCPSCSTTSTVPVEDHPTNDDVKAWRCPECRGVHEPSDVQKTNDDDDAE